MKTVYLKKVNSFLLTVSLTSKTQLLKRAQQNHNAQPAFLFSWIFNFTVVLNFCHVLHKQKLVRSDTSHVDSKLKKYETSCYNEDKCAQP